MLDRILVLQHKGGEYIAVNISGIVDNRHEIWETIKRAEDLIKRPSSSSNIAFQVLDTKFDQKEIDEIVKCMSENKKGIFRLAIIGVTFKQKVRFNRSFRKTKTKINRQFIYDWEEAKDWLVGK